jgi:hypothetical protein
MRGMGIVVQHTVLKATGDDDVDEQTLWKDNRGTVSSNILP